MKIGGTSVDPATQFAMQSPAATAPEATATAAQIKVFKKAMDNEAAMAQQLIAQVEGKGGLIDVKA
ncbi:putative motility protein [Myxococcota bacterium]|nr:putative motility protein [Myxococcota bacterium]MBU1430437.1 putative motility protein [Myxococcota bacterium]MBU1896490.1 putative motility protein [Myxococcota bacterium]